MKQFVAFWRAEVIGVFEFLDECEEACPDVFDTSDGGLQGLLFPKTGIPFDCDLIFPVEVDLEEKIDISQGNTYRCLLVEDIERLLDIVVHHLVVGWLGLESLILDPAFEDMLPSRLDGFTKRLDQFILGLFIRFYDIGKFVRAKFKAPNGM